MKKLLILFPILLSGCSIIQRFQPDPYDPNLYDHLVKLLVIANTASGQCRTIPVNGSITSLIRETNYVATWVQYRDSDVKISIDLLNKNIQELNKMYETGTPSVSYCKIKFEIINNELNDILTVEGKKK